MSDLPERWLPVVGFEGHYEVSSIGRVRNVSGYVHKAPANERGYRRVSLRGKVRRVHTLVAEAFHGERPHGFDTRHLDGDSLNNCASNLAWGTRSENMLDQVMHGGHHQASKTHCPQGHPYGIANTLHHGGRRHCRQCQSEAKHRFRQRRCSA